MNILLNAIFLLEANVSTTESLSKSCILEFSVKQNIQAAGLRHLSNGSFTRGYNFA
jgi:hypothetical protein